MNGVILKGKHGDVFFEKQSTLFPAKPAAKQSVKPVLKQVPHKKRVTTTYVQLFSPYSYTNSQAHNNRFVKNKPFLVKWEQWSQLKLTVLVKSMHSKIHHRCIVQSSVPIFRKRNLTFYWRELHLFSVLMHLPRRGWDFEIITPTPGGGTMNVLDISMLRVQ